MDEATTARIDILVKKRRQLDKDVKLNKKEYDALWEQSRLEAIEIEKELAILCEHTWTRETHLYAELYCSICFIEQMRWKRLDNECKKAEVCSDS